MSKNLFAIFFIQGALMGIFLLRGAFSKNKVVDATNFAFTYHNFIFLHRYICLYNFMNKKIRSTTHMQIY